MMQITRGAERTAKPNIFISHSSRDKAAALELASTLNLCAIDVWLNDWELEVGQNLTDELAKAMERFPFYCHPDYRELQQDSLDKDGI